MTVEELKNEAGKIGYTCNKKPCYQCSCYISYPNFMHRRKTSWKCIDKYIPIKFERKSQYGTVTRCVRKREVKRYEDTI